MKACVRICKDKKENEQQGGKYVKLVKWWEVQPGVPKTDPRWIKGEKEKDDKNKR